MGLIEKVEIFDVPEQTIKIRPARYNRGYNILGIFPENGRIYLRYIADDRERYSTRTVTGFQDGPIPNWLQQRLYIGTYYPTSGGGARNLFMD